MRLVTLFSAGSHIPAATLNAMQARGAGLTRASGAPSDGPTAQGADLLHYQTPDAGLATGAVATVDATSGYDWRERLVLTWARFASSAAGRWGRASEHAGNDAASSDLRTALGVTGPGATGTAAATVANGTPPVVGTDSCPIPLDVRAGGTLWLFADPSSGALKVYNATGATLHFDLLFVATGRAVDPSAPPPDIVPTMTEVLWLTPTVAASRPTNPGATIALHRATDTGSVALWDGGAWRSIVDASDAMLRAQVNTADNTWTTLATWTTTEELAVMEVSFSVVARRDDWDAGGSWRGRCAHRRMVSSYIPMGPVDWWPPIVDGVGLDVRITEDSSGVHLQVQGAAMGEYRWQVKATRNVLED